eukprot:2643166-Amphidinium_carterae.1
MYLLILPQIGSIRASQDATAHKLFTEDIAASMRFFWLSMASFPGELIRITAVTNLNQRRKTTAYHYRAPTLISQ